MIDPRNIHLVALKRVFRYLKGTKGYKLTYKNTDSKLTVSIDASWNSNKNAKPFEKYTVTIGGNLVSWRSKKQTLVALSICEAELMAICEGVQELKWMQGLLKSSELDIRNKLPINIKSDSKAAIHWVNHLKITVRNNIRKECQVYNL